MVAEHPATFDAPLKIWGLGRFRHSQPAYAERNDSGTELRCDLQLSLRTLRFLQPEGIGVSHFQVSVANSKICAPYSGSKLLVSTFDKVLGVGHTPSPRSSLQRAAPCDSRKQDLSTMTRNGLPSDSLPLAFLSPRAFTTPSRGPPLRRRHGVTPLGGGSHFSLHLRRIADVSPGHVWARPRLAFPLRHTGARVSGSAS